MSLLQFKKGLIIGTIMSGSISSLLTKLYIDKYYILFPNTIDSYINTYKKRNNNGRINE
jgi:hypothetical protein